MKSEKFVRILHAHKYFHERDGAGRYMLSLMRALRARGHAVAPFAMHDPRNLPNEWERYFVSALDTARPGVGLVAFRQVGRATWSCEAERKMTAMLRAFSPDVVHAHNLATHLSPSVLAAARRADVPVVMTVHDYALASANYALWGGEAPLHAGSNSFFSVAQSRFVKGSFLATALLESITRLHRMFRLYDRCVDRYLTLSQFVKDVLVDVGYDAERIDVVPPCIELPPEPLVRGDGDGVLYVGRLETYKGVATLIDAMRACKGISLHVVGDGPARAACIARARGMRNVRFSGFLSGRALWDAYAAARVLVVPSLWDEPFGLVTLEAMARGVPAIVSDRGGLPEAVEDGVSGLVVPAGNADALARAIRRFFDDVAWARALGKAARVRAATVGDVARHCSAILGVYHKVVDNSQK